MEPTASISSRPLLDHLRPCRNGKTLIATNPAGMAVLIANGAWSISTGVLTGHAANGVQRTG
jgi:hypothetical protein